MARRRRSSRCSRPARSLPRTQLIWANKGDLLNEGNRTALDAMPHVIVGSAEHGDGIETLLERMASHLPMSPFLYPSDELSTQPVRFFAAEAIRESALAILHEEVPYGIFVDIEEFRESKSPIYIRAVVYVERDSQKGIVLGAKGRTIRDIGTASRVLIEKLVDGRGVPRSLGQGDAGLAKGCHRAATLWLYRASGVERDDIRTGTARDPALPEVQGAPADGRGRSASTGLPSVPAALRRIRDGIPIMLIDEALPIAAVLTGLRMGGSIVSSG